MKNLEFANINNLEDIINKGKSLLGRTIINYRVAPGDQEKAIFYLKENFAKENYDVTDEFCIIYDGVCEQIVTESYVRNPGNFYDDYTNVKAWLEYLLESNTLKEVSVNQDIILNKEKEINNLLSDTIKKLSELNNITEEEMNEFKSTIKLSSDKLHEIILKKQCPGLYYR